MAARSAREGGDRGLPSLAEAREERRRVAAFGGGLRGLAPRFWLWTVLGIGVFIVLYWKWAEGQLESQKSAVMAKQRAVAQELGPRILPFRDRIEAWVLELAGPWRGASIAPGLPIQDVRKGPGIYLRLRLANARDVVALRKASVRSLQDGFTSCLFVRKGGADPKSGPRCNTPADCDPGLLCNEWDVCAPPTQPYNMRLAYRALRILSTEWTDELHQAKNDLAVRAFDRDLDRATHDDVPIAIEILHRARFFTLVLDEDPEGGLPEDADGGRRETDEQRVQRVPHMARVGIWDLRTGERIAAVRNRAAGRFVPMGDRVVTDRSVVAAQQRQVNNCALAMGLRQAFARRSAGQDRSSSGSDGGAPGAPDAGSPRPGSP